MRPDDREKRAIIPRDYLMDATDWHRVDPPFRPGYEKRYFGYGNQFWLFPGETRRFAPIGVYGQIIFVDPQLKLVMVQTTANATAMADGTLLARERDAFWRGAGSALWVMVKPTRCRLCNIGPRRCEEKFSLKFNPPITRTVRQRHRVLGV